MDDLETALSGAPAQNDPTAGFSAPVPKTPAELEERKGVWKQTLDTINSDPNILRAMMVAGLSMMRPGADFGSSALQGVATYEAGRQADLAQKAKDFEQGRVLAQDERASQLHRSQLQTQELNRTNLSQQMDFRGQEQPLALDEKRERLNQIKAQIRNLDADNKRGDVGIALQRERLQLEREMKDADRELRGRELTMREIDMHERRRLDDERKKAVGGGVAGKATDAERAIQGLMLTDEIQALPENERRAAATLEYSRMTRGMSGTVNAEGRVATAQQQALDTYFAYRDMDPTDRDMTFMLNPQTRVLFMRGQQLAEGSGTAAPVQSGQAAPRKPISAAEIRERMGAK